MANQKFCFAHNWLIYKSVPQPPTHELVLLRNRDSLKVSLDT
jgi:hypothetical protein